MQWMLFEVQSSLQLEQLGYSTAVRCQRSGGRPRYAAAVLRKGLLIMQLADLKLPPYFFRQGPFGFPPFLHPGKSKTTPIFTRALVRPRKT
jgi:hypothetical protein